MEIQDIGEFVGSITVLASAVSALLWRLYMRPRVETLVSEEIEKMATMVNEKAESIRAEQHKCRVDMDKRFASDHTDTKERIEEVKTDMKYIRDKVDKILELFLAQATQRGNA